MKEITFEHALILAICRCSMCNATNATKHQINRLRDYYKETHPKMADKLDELLNPKPNEMDGLRFVRSDIYDHSTMD